MQCSKSNKPTAGRRCAVWRHAIGVLLVSFPLAAGHAGAQEAPLFQRVETRAVDSSSDDDARQGLRSTTRIPTRGGETVRHREVHVDFARLDTVKAAIDAGEPATLNLNLFDDVGFKAVSLRVAPTASGGYSLAGGLDRELGTATLVVNGRHLLGTVRTPSATYAIDTVNGSCHIRQVDSSTLPPLGEPLRPRESSASPFRPRASVRAASSAAAGRETSFVDVLVLYTPAVTEELGGVFPVEAMVDLFVAETNQAYTDSGVDQQVFLTRAVEVDYDEVPNSTLTLYQLANPSDGNMDIAHELREKTGSDLVHLITQAGDVCGIAFLMFNVSPVFESRGFGLTIQTCGGDTFAHELGHNMGLRHDRYVDPGNSPYPYSHGYVNQVAFEQGAQASARWRTIMSYRDQCNDEGLVCRELLRFSNADQEYEGDPMGVAEGSDAPGGPADAVRSLNDTRMTVAGFREPGPDLVALVTLLTRAWQPRQAFTVIGQVKNEGRVESAGTTATLYRSTDPVIGTDDHEVLEVPVGALGAKGEHPVVHAGTAPEEPGTYYYGLCVDAVDGETDTDNCSPAVHVTVGPTVSAMAPPRPLKEGQPVTFSIELSEARDTDVDVQWKLVGVTAVADLDYVESSGTLTIPANETVGSISVETKQDDALEGDDTFTLVLIGTTPPPPTGVVLSVDGIEVTGVIEDDSGVHEFEDQKLHDIVLRALGKSTDAEYTVEELASIRQLDASGSEVEMLGGLEAATGLETLILDGNAVTNLAPLGHLAKLTRLELADNGIVDLSGLKPVTGLRRLGLAGNPIADISPLTQLLDLRQLDLESGSVADIEPLADLTDLTTLNLNFNDIGDISPLVRMTRMTTLDLWGNKITDVSALREMKGLFWVDLDDNAITDIEPLRGLTTLNALHLNGNDVRTLEPLAGLVNLIVLGLNDNRIVGLTPLSNMTDLEVVWLEGNSVTDVSPLAGLNRLERLYLGRNAISGLSGLSRLTLLRVLELQDNRIRDISPIAKLTRLRVLDLADNGIRDLSPLQDLRRLRRLDLANNDIRDIEPLLANSGLGAGDTVYLHGNPLDDPSINIHIPALTERNVDVYRIGVSVAAASAPEGGSLEFPVRLSVAAPDEVVVNWAVSEDDDDEEEPSLATATPDEDYPGNQSGSVTISAGELEATFPVLTNEDGTTEAHETVEVSLTAPEGGFGDGVTLADASGLGLIVEPSTPTADVPLFAPAGHATRQGFVRVINRSDRNVVHIGAADDAGNRHSTTLALDVGETVHFNSNDLEQGNFAKGLSRGVGDGTEDWRLALSGNDVEVLTYMRTNDGFLTSLHDLVPPGPDGYEVPIFNPGKNINQESQLRLINDGDADADLTITGVDDDGTTSPEARMTLAAGEALTLTAAELEDEGLGQGTGKWRLLISSDQPIGVASLMQSPTEHLTNLSTAPDNTEAVEEATAHHVYLFPSASDALGRQGFVRVVNHGDAGSVEIQAYDDTDLDHETVELAIDANKTVHFNSDDLETGKADKGLSGSTGAGEGDWRLVLTSGLDLDVLAYIRTEDGFLTSMHDTVPETGGVYRVPIFNPGSNRNQVSVLRIVNTGEDEAAVTISGVDDAGLSSRGAVRLSVAAGKTREISAGDLESGGDDLTGVLGDGIGKWRLEVRSDAPIRVMSLLRSPTGHLTNLSTTPAIDEDRD